MLSRQVPFAIFCFVALFGVPMHSAGAADAPVSDSKESGLAVMDLVAVSGVPKGLGQLLNEALLTRLKKSGRFSMILSSSDMRGGSWMDDDRRFLRAAVRMGINPLTVTDGIAFDLALPIIGFRLVLEAP